MYYERTSLEKFSEAADYPDGHYAVWKTGKTINEKGTSFLYGFSGEVVEYTQQEGFKNYPDWMDETPEDRIGIVLLSEIPSVHELISGEF